MTLAETQPLVAPAPIPSAGADLRDPLVDPLAADDAVQLDDASAFEGDNTFGAGWKKGQGIASGGGTPTTQVKAEWKGDGT